MPTKWKELTQTVQPSADKLLEIRKVEALERIAKPLDKYIGLVVLYGFTGKRG